MCDALQINNSLLHSPLPSRVSPPLPPHTHIHTQRPSTHYLGLLWVDSVHSEPPLHIVHQTEVLSSFINCDHIFCVCVCVCLGVGVWACGCGVGVRVCVCCVCVCVCMCVQVCMNE